jgi:hypothetical protein
MRNMSPETKKRERNAVSRVAMAAMLACLGLWLAGCAEGGAMSSAPAQPQIAATVTTCNRTPSGCVTQGSFSLAAMRDLAVHVDWQNVPPGTRTQKLELLDPGGGSYQVVNASFVIEEGATGSAATDALIPISGSAIAQRQITGSWTIRISLDGVLVATQGVAFQP